LRWLAWTALALSLVSLVSAIVYVFTTDFSVYISSSTICYQFMEGTRRALHSLTFIMLVLLPRLPARGRYLQAAVIAALIVVFAFESSHSLHWRPLRLILEVSSYTASVIATVAVPILAWYAIFRRQLAPHA